VQAKAQAGEFQDDLFDVMDMHGDHAAAGFYSTPMRQGRRPVDL